MQSRSLLIAFELEAVDSKRNPFKSLRRPAERSGAAKFKLLPFTYDPLSVEVSDEV